MEERPSEVPQESVAEEEAGIHRLPLRTRRLPVRHSHCLQEAEEEEARTCNCPTLALGFE